MSQSLLLSQSRLSLPVHHVTWDAWTASHARSLAWLFSACLFQILLLFKVLDLNTYKPHRYTLQLRQHKSQHSNYTHAHFSSFLYFTLVSWRGLQKNLLACGCPSASISKSKYAHMHTARGGGIIPPWEESNQSGGGRGGWAQRGTDFEVRYVAEFLAIFLKAFKN
jgi:hypothetical protein